MGPKKEFKFSAEMFNRATRRKMRKNMRAKAPIHTKKHTRGRLKMYGKPVPPRKKVCE